MSVAICAAIATWSGELRPRRTSVATGSRALRPTPPRGPVDAPGWWSRLIALLGAALGVTPIFLAPIIGNTP